jgi:hypothetical protein
MTNLETRRKTRCSWDLAFSKKKNRAPADSCLKIRCCQRGILCPMRQRNALSC